MEIVEQIKGEGRNKYLLRVAAAYIKDHWPDGTIQYDEAVCDGYCLVEDLENEADILF